LKIGQGTEIHPNTIIIGNVRIGENCRIGWEGGATIENSTLEDGAQVIRGARIINCHLFGGRAPYFLANIRDEGGTDVKGVYKDQQATGLAVKDLHINTGRTVMYKNDNPKNTIVITAAYYRHNHGVRKGISEVRIESPYYDSVFGRERIIKKLMEYGFNFWKLKIKASDLR
jgi:NDP-sugar pyrophosphorylase family protein